MLSIAAIDQHLSEQGHFCLIDWLMSHNHINYRDYEAWRYGQLALLESQLSLNESTFISLLETTQKHCQDLKLHPEDQPFFRWDSQQDSPLKASKDPERHRQLTQQWSRQDTTLQLDIFMDNSAIIAENATRDALSNRQFDKAQTALLQLAELNPQHPLLGGFQDLVNYGLHLQNQRVIDNASMATEFDGLYQEVRPLALSTLGASARDYLAYAWQRLADNLVDYPYSAATPEQHTAFACAQIPDWHGVIAALPDNSTWQQQPFLMQLKANAFTQLGNQGEALLLWCRLIDIAPEETEQRLDNDKPNLVYPLWEDFWAYRDDIPAAYFSAYLFAIQPGLIQLITTACIFEHEATNAMIALIKAHQAGENEITAREQLKKVDSVLLDLYLRCRKD